MTGDRTVHARYDGMEIVRYDSAGKWYLEPTDLSLPRQRVALAGAVSAAVHAMNTTGEVHFGLPGGSTFDAKVRHAFPKPGTDQ